MEPTGSLSHFQFVVESGGGVFRGVMAGDKAIDLVPVILFDDPQHPPRRRSTMGLNPEDLSIESVRSKILHQRALFAEVS